MNPEFYRRGVVEVARELIGCVLVCGDCAGVIVETEAYHDLEPACHAYRGLTDRTARLFGEPGLAYVYRSYGIHALFNAVCCEPDIGAAVLIRALEPISGLDLMAERRGLPVDDPRKLCSGPGKLTQALGIELADNGGSLEMGRVRIAPRAVASGPLPVQSGRRIGISQATELPWRFGLAGSRFLSRAI